MPPPEAPPASPAGPPPPAAPSWPPATAPSAPPPTAPGASAPLTRAGSPSALDPLKTPLAAAPSAASTLSQLQAAARELAQAAERTERSALEILSRALALSDQLAKSLEGAARHSAAGGLAMLLSATLLCAASAVLSTLVTLAALHPGITVLDLLRILLRRN
jgi:hypothetical protein